MEKTRCVACVMVMDGYTEVGGGWLGGRLALMHAFAC